MFFGPSFCNFHGQYCSPVTHFLQKTLLWASHTANSHFPIWKWDQLSFSNGHEICHVWLHQACWNCCLILLIAWCTFVFPKGEEKLLSSMRRVDDALCEWHKVMMLWLHSVLLCLVNLIWPHCFFDYLTCFCGVSSVQFFWLSCSPWEEQVLNPLHHIHTESRLLEIKRPTYDS